MVDLLKAFGRGIIYILCFPFFLVALAIFAVIGLIAFIFQLVKSIIFFFTGQKFFPELPEDKELRLMREAEEAKRNPQPQPQMQQPVNNPVQDGGLLFEETYDEDDFLEEPAPAPVAPAPQPVQPQPATIEEAVFVEEPKAAPLPTPAPAPAPAPQPAPQQAPQVQEVNRPEPEQSQGLLHEEDDALGEFLDPFDAEKEQAEEEELEVYQPKGTTDDIYQIDEDEDTDSGVNINYND